MLIAKTVHSENELQQILRLQKKYLQGQTTDEEEKEQGFLTVAHTLDVLEQMHLAEPSVIVKDGDELAGYALVMPKKCRKMIPVLVPLFETFDHLDYSGKPMNDYSFYVMGQICVAKAWRGKGVFDMLYHKHRELFKQKYDFVITVISTRNHRSLKAHERVGFKNIHTYTDATDEWAMVLWNWQ